MTRVKLVGAVLLALAAALIVIQNTSTVRTRVFFVPIEMPLAVLLLIATLLGFALGVLVSLRATRRRDRPSP
jgi:uncharacterized integral membrane protein